MFIDRLPRSTSQLHADPVVKRKLNETPNVRTLLETTIGEQPDGGGLSWCGRLPVYQKNYCVLEFRMTSGPTSTGYLGNHLHNHPDAFCKIRSNIAAALAMTTEPKVMRAPMKTPPARSSLSPSIMKISPTATKP